MADFLIRIRDKESSGDAETDAQQFKRGDVLVVCPTPWPWTAAELSNPDWRIVRLPNVSVEAGSELIREERQSLVAGSRLMRKRRACLKVDAMPAAVVAWLADDSRAVPVFAHNMSETAFAAFVEAKAPRQAIRVL